MEKSLKPEIIEKVKLLEEKYASMGQDLSSYLDGLLYADYLTYWDYIHLDTLLSLQNPKTSFPDEEIFIMYHQITELYFKLTLHEMKQIGAQEKIDPIFFKSRLQRINRYFEALVSSFEVMVNGMDKEQFLKYRMSLLPASGFQSAQYRMIEICATDFMNLVAKDKRANYTEQSTIAEMYQEIYWKYGATELATGEKTLTLKQFEGKYSKVLIELAESFKSSNLLKQFEKIDSNHELYEDIRSQLRFIDVNVNVNWPLSHYKSAVRYLQKDPEDIAATGGTNWQKYLPPRFQKRIFYPSLWSDEELENWGKGWVKKEVFGIKDSE